MDMKRPNRSGAGRPSVYNSGANADEMRYLEAKMKRGKRRAGFSALFGILCILSVMVHFFLSPLNSKILLSGGYTGTYFAILPMVLGMLAVIMAVASRKILPKGEDGFSIVGMITGIIGFLFGTAQLFTCTMCVQFNWFGINLVNMT